MIKKSLSFNYAHNNTVSFGYRDGQHIVRNDEQRRDGFVTVI